MSLYPEKSLMQSAEVQSIDELIELLIAFKTTGTNNIDLVTMGDDGEMIRYSDALVRVELIEKTLSDDSKMHDIKLTFSELE